MLDILNTLREITKGLPPVPFVDLKVTPVPTGQEYTEYAVQNGRMRMFALFSTADISIAEGYISEGSIIQKHMHPECYEILIVMEGKMVVYVDGETKELNKLDKIIIPMNQPHTAVAVTDCWFVAITVPKDEGFPTTTATK